METPFGHLDPATLSMLSQLVTIATFALVLLLGYKLLTRSGDKRD